MPPGRRQQAVEANAQGQIGGVDHRVVKEVPGAPVQQGCQGVKLPGDNHIQ